MRGENGGKEVSPSARLQTMEDHLFTGFREGWMSDFGGFKQSYQKILPWIVGLTLIGFTWVAVNAPTTEWSRVGIIYTLIGGLGLMGAALNVANPKSLPPIGGPQYVGDFGVVGDMTLGAGTVIATLSSNFFLFFVIDTPVFYTGQFTAFPRMWLVNFMVVGLMIPIAEETFFGVIEGSAVEDFGVVPGIALVTFAFPMFHWAVYGQEWGVLLSIALWRLVAAFVFVFTRSWGAPLFAHIIINSSSAIKLTILREIPTLPYNAFVLAGVLLLLLIGFVLYFKRERGYNKTFKEYASRLG